MRLLVVEDDLKIAQELKILLEHENYEVETLTNFSSIIEDILTKDCDLMLLDINLPNQNGFQICREIKKKRQTPIIFVTSRNTEEDELIRRALKLNDPVRYKELKVHDVTLDLHLSKVRFQDKEVELTRNEFRILYYLFLNVGVVLSKEKLIEFLWNDQYYLDETILLVNINRLRKKLEDIDLSDLVKTKRGVGYFI